MTNALPAIIEERKQYSNDRLTELRQELATLDSLRDLDGLSIYATGSFARREASSFSDIDLFFMQANGEEPIKRLEKTLLDADLIRLVDRLGYPKFSRDGEFLKVHPLERLIRNLGSPDDDYENTFSARLLLLLESVCIADDSTYDDALRQVVDSYFRDYADHSGEFRPIFLLNDIVRFWKTLCLNYEHRRNTGVADLIERNGNHLKNLKLKFSRMLTCFSVVALLMDESEPYDHERILTIARTPPLERLADFAEKFQAKGGLEIFDYLTADYGWFLEVTGSDKDSVLQWIGDDLQRKDAFDRAKRFGQNMFLMLSLPGEYQKLFRFLVI